MKEWRWSCVVDKKEGKARGWRPFLRRYSTALHATTNYHHGQSMLTRSSVFESFLKKRPCFLNRTSRARLSTRTVFSPTTSPFREGDTAILVNIDKPDAEPFLSKPLRRDGTLQCHRGNFAHNDILGQHPRALISSTNGSKARLLHPTLAQYVRMTTRIPTPVYAGEANLIVSLLDIHASPPDSAGDAPALEILEAGTGHGSLTLHLARAIHAANAHLPDGWHEHSAEELTEDRRGAVVHTIDINEKHSNNARKVVRGFHRGMYAGDVDFHVGTIAAFCEQQKSVRGSEAPFLSYAVLDLPQAEDAVAQVSSSLLPNGTVAVFCPSVTQLLECLRVVKREKVPLRLEETVELGANLSAGKQWDLRLVRPRKSHAATSESSAPVSPNGETQAATEGDTAETRVDELKAICRPKFFERTLGGGFLGLWRKHSAD